MFKREKVLHMIGLLLKLNGGKMEHLKLMKELYLIDRESFDDRNSSVSGDSHVGLARGPVLSTTYFIFHDLRSGSSRDPWAEYLNVNDTYITTTEKAIGQGMLSARDKQYITKIFDTFKDSSSEEIVEHTHNLPEWKAMQGSIGKLKFADIMRALGKSEDAIEFYKEQYRGIYDLYEKLDHCEKEAK